MTNETLRLGRDVKTGEDVYIDIFHTLVAGQTNLSGKTTTTITLAKQAIEKDYTVLAFDSKPTLREFAGFHDIPVCYQPTTDPLVLIGLLEAKRKARLNPLYATLGRISERAKTIQDIIKNAHDMEERSRSGFVKDACWTLADLLGRLDEELSQLRFSETLELEKGGFNVMPVNKLSAEAQQLVLKTAFEELLKHHNRRVIAIIDEGYQFLPQDYGSACKRAIQSVITQGAKTGLFVWLTTQFLAPTEKDAMKAMPNKLLGRQDHNTEIEATTKIIPGAKRLLTAEDLMTLKRGEFFLVPLEGKVRKIYVDRPALQIQRPDFPDTVVPWQDRLHAEVAFMEKNMLKAMHQTLEQFKEEYDGKLRALALPPIGAPWPIERKIDHTVEEWRITLNEKELHYTTENILGQIMFAIVNDLEGKPSSISQISDAMREYSWAPHEKTIRINLANLVKKGDLVREGTTKDSVYRTPRKVKVTVEKN